MKIVHIYVACKPFHYIALSISTILERKHFWKLTWFVKLQFFSLAAASELSDFKEVSEYLIVKVLEN